jgi:hypothetical protein
MNIQTKEKFNISGKVKIITTKVGTDEVLRETDWMKNLVMNGASTGINLIAQKLCGDNTYSLNINKADIGTGTNTPANGDTQLQTAVARGVATPQGSAGGVATLKFFFSDGVLANGTYKEFGTFVDGGVAVNTGQIFNRILFGTPYTKGTGEDTTILVTLTISN